MTIEEDAIAILETEKEVLYDQVETIEAAIKWCILNKAVVSFLSGVTITIGEGSWKGETFLDVVDDIKKQLAEKGEKPYAIGN